MGEFQAQHLTCAGILAAIKMSRRESGMPVAGFSGFARPILALRRKNGSGTRRAD
jgi:hypothetical protein